MSYSSSSLSLGHHRGSGTEEVLSKAHPTPALTAAWDGSEEHHGQTGPLCTFQMRQLRSGEKASAQSHPERQAAPPRTRTPITSTSSAQLRLFVLHWASWNFLGTKFQLAFVSDLFDIGLSSEETHRPSGEIWGNQNLYPFSTLFITLSTLTVNFHLMLKAEVYSVGVRLDRSQWWPMSRNKSILGTICPGNAMWDLPHCEASCYTLAYM